MSIIIPVKNDVRIVNCIKSVDADVEIVVVFNGATEEFKHIVDEFNVTVVELKEAGLSNAYNEGISKAKYGKILLMDSDCVFTKGCIKKLYVGLEKAKLSKGNVKFLKETYIRNIVAKTREFTTSDFCNAFSPPLAFNKDIEADIGYFFHPNLKWEEDWEFNLRVMKKGLKIYWDKTAIVYHPSLSIRSDLKSAFNYGIGHAQGTQMGVFGEEKELSFNVLISATKTQFLYLKEQKGILAAIYYEIWKIAYRYGKTYQKRRYKNEKNFSDSPASR